MSLSLQETFSIAGEFDALWAHLSDVDVVAGCFPGASLEGRRPDGSYDGTITIALGPTKVRFAGTLNMEYDHIAHSVTLTAQGGDPRRTRASANAQVQLSGTRPGMSSLAVDATIDIDGPLAQFARAGGVQMTRTLIATFASNVESSMADVVHTAEHDPLMPQPMGVVADANTTPPASVQRKGPPGTMSLGRLISRSAIDGIRRAVRRARSKLAQLHERASNAARTRRERVR